MQAASTLTAVGTFAQSWRQDGLRRLLNWLADPLRVGFAMLLVAAALMPLNAIRVTGTTIAADVPLALAALALIAALLTRGQQLWLPPGLLVVLALAVVSLVAQEHFEFGGLRADVVIWTVLMLCWVVVPVLYANLPAPSWTRLTLLFKVWLLGAVFGALVCVLQSRGVGLGPLERWTNVNGARYAGLTLHPNNLAMASALAVPGCVLLATMARRWRDALIWGGCAFLCLWSINISGSRAGLLAPLLPTAAVLTLHVLRGHMSRSSLLRVGLVVLVLLLMLSMRGSGVEGPSGQSAIERMFFDDGSGRKADFIRVAQHAYSEARFETAPIFGTGWGWVQNAEKHYLSLMESGGALGLLMGLTHQLVIAYAALLALLAHARDSERSKIVLGLIAAWLTFLAMGFKHPLLLERDCYVPMGMLLLASRLRDLRVDTQAPAAAPGLP